MRVWAEIKTEDELTRVRKALQAQKADRVAEIQSAIDSGEFYARPAWFSGPADYAEWGAYYVQREWRREMEAKRAVEQETEWEAAEAVMKLDAWEWPALGAPPPSPTLVRKPTNYWDWLPAELQEKILRHRWEAVMKPRWRMVRVRMLVLYRLSLVEFEFDERPSNRLLQWLWNHSDFSDLASFLPPKSNCPRHCARRRCKYCEYDYCVVEIDPEYDELNELHPDEWSAKREWQLDYDDSDCDVCQECEAVEAREVVRVERAKKHAAWRAKDSAFV